MNLLFQQLKQRRARGESYSSMGVFSLPLPVEQLVPTVVNYRPMRMFVRPCFELNTDRTGVEQICKLIDLPEGDLGHLIIRPLAQLSTVEVIAPTGNFVLSSEQKELYERGLREDALEEDKAISWILTQSLIKQGKDLQMERQKKQDNILDGLIIVLEQDYFSSKSLESKRLGKPLGRPRYKANQWAYDQVHVQKRRQVDVYAEWEAKLREEIGSEQFDLLADPAESFSKAIKEKKKK